MDRLTRLVAVALMCSACRTHEDSAVTRLAEISAREESDRREIAAMADDVAAFRVASRALVSEFDQTAAAFARASRGFERARENDERGGRLAESARADFDRAAIAYRHAATLVILAAGYDVAGNLCATTESTRSYRARVGAAVGQDVDHSWPHALGGANHPLNYNYMNSSLNRSLGTAVVEKFAIIPIELLQGLAVSALMRLRCGDDPRAFGR